MIEIVESSTFKRWLHDLRDRGAVARINARNLGGSISEIRIHNGPGYRLYFMRDGTTAIMLCGGDKDSQQRDIPRARRIAKDWRQA